MWTNVFRIGELQVVSWFQFLPYESDPNPLPEKSLKSEQKDAATYLVLSAHLQLQNNGFLSTWTNSFVGPWDPSQGIHNPDEKIKLWLFLPGRHSSIDESAQAAVSKLRVIGTGLWLAPGDSEEVAVALSQALRNSLERSLRGLSYVRFGDVFTKCHSFASNTQNFRRVQPTIEFIFSVNEEAIYVHAIISAKHVRGLCSDDMERVSKHRSSNSTGEGLPVIVAPNGMRGRLTGCCPSDLVKHVYISKNKASKGLIGGMPFDVAQSSGCQLRGQSCFVEITLGCSSKCSSKTLESGVNQNKNTIHHGEVQMKPVGRSQQKQGSEDQLAILQRTFIYQPETVLVPLMHKAFARTSLKRFCRKNWSQKSLTELWPLWGFSYSSHIEHCLAFGSTCNDVIDGLEVDNMRLQRRLNSNSNSSSISSVSSTSSESDNVMAIDGDDLEADADSHGSKRAALLSNEQLENDGSRMVKRPRTGTDALGQTAGVLVQDANNSASAGLINFESQWDWDDDDDEKGFGLDIQIILSEFGDFGDFFENDVLSFGEPPGTAESQVLMLPAPDCEDVSASPCTGGMDVDQKLSPVALTSFEGVHLPRLALTENTQSKNTESTRDSRSLAENHFLPPSMGKFDYLTKAEAMMSFAPEYAAVETPVSEFSTSIFKSPYLPRSKRVESLQSSTSAYVYGITPSSSCVETSEEKLETTGKVGSAGHDTNSSARSSKLYDLVQVGRKKNDSKSTNNDISLLKGDASSLSGINSSTTTFTLQRKNEQTFEAGHLLLPVKTVLATEIECIMFQAAMCRIRHTLLSLNNHLPFGLSNVAGNVMPESCITRTPSDMVPNKYDMKKKDSLPVRIAGEFDGGIFEEPLTAQVGVWRSVGVPKVTKSSNMRISENSSSLAGNMLTDDGLSFSGQRQPLQELLDAMVLLVQQSTSFVDISLDMDDSESSYYLLALQEQGRRGFSCGPSMVHAGCGGLLATCHYMDIAGIDLIDPLSADVPPSSVISLLQSDIKVAMKSAFGNPDGPLTVFDWCKGRSQSIDSGASGDGYSYVSETKDSSGNLTIVGDSISPQSIGGSSCIREGPRMDESSQRRLSQEMGNSESEQQKGYSCGRPTVAVLPLPSILVGYQDDWLKTSPNCLEFWEKGLEPYALQKSVTYCAVCPDINLLTSAAADFFQQLGTVYEACRLGTHSPLVNGSQMELSPGKGPSSGLVLVDCPQQVKVAGNNLFSISSISDYFLALSKSWSVDKFISALGKVIRDLKLTTSSSQNQKEGSAGPCTVVYVVCPFPDSTAVLRTLIESSAAIGSVVLSPDRERQSWLLSQVARAQSCPAAADEVTSNVVMLSGFSIPKLVLQIVTVDCLLRVNRPVSELTVLKDIAFTVYNKARRVSRPIPSNDMFRTLSASGRQQASLMHAASPIQGMWKDCLAPRMSGSSLSREGELDAALRPGAWDNSWQASRTGLDSNRSADLHFQDETRCMFEPLFILAEPGSLERGSSVSVLGSASLESSSSKSGIDDSSGIYMQNSNSGRNSEVGTNSLLDIADHDQKLASLHCCYGWTEDWRWLACIWTDSRGELLDCNIFPFGGISSCQDTKVLQSLFVQVLHQGCQILSSSPDSGSVKARDIIITRIGGFFELECQEWQNAIYSVGGNDVKKWPLQLRRSTLNILSSSTNGTSLQQHEMGLIQERNLPPSPSSSLYSPRAKTSYMKSGLGQGNTKKQLLAGQTGADNSRGLLQLVQSISLVGVSIDHSLYLMLPADSSSSGTGTQNSSSGSTFSGYVEGFSPVKSVGSMPASYIVIPSPNMRSLSPTPLQLPTCLTSESPPLAHLLHSKGSAIPLSTGYIVSKAVPTMRKDPAEPVKDDWPSVLSVTLIDHYGGNNSSSSSNSSIQDKVGRGGSKQGRGVSIGPEAISNRDYELETHLVLQSVAAELQALSWMTVSPVYLERRSALPFHCDMILRLRRLLHYADKELSRPPDRAQGVS
ncbi:uncharacterized protein A4U43_C03F15350 [Asparagus officinalis]|uniref:Mediator of RNA polymerase II transcription subunit 13 n=1 Tax=Asparagus officinalis TaxID=4686 RepID=A0A5P1FC20_ASPOF|nr:mediator of RNA polymerase II transcription subunit 13 [Asparagus officinalis]XP_020257149.1 mediator of RNA polymerase II transcription subunit 13 [Asparagus officinalis]ONK75293.1 uncharacterized protein A4U43_C03F15350 [Asparagus officinalis]